MWNLFWLNAAYIYFRLCLFLIASFIRKSTKMLYRALKMIKNGIKLHFPVITVGEILLLGIQNVYRCWWTASLLLAVFSISISLLVISPFFWQTNSYPFSHHCWQQVKNNNNNDNLQARVQMKCENKNTLFASVMR